MWVLRSAFNSVVRGLQEAASAAADAEETMNLFNVVFEEVSENADSMASKMSASFGVAKSSIMQGLSTLGDFAEGLGMTSREALNFSTTLSDRMMDVISFKNVAGDTTDILKNLASGLAGNTENFRTWGVVIKESSVKLWLAQNNMDKLTGTALELAKVQARAALFMEQTTNAAGDMARTFDSTVNVTRRLKEAQKQLSEDIGVGVNELATPIKKGLLDLVEKWNWATEAKKAYADIDPYEKDRQEKAQKADTSNVDRVTAFLRAYALPRYQQQIYSGGGLATSGGQRKVLENKDISNIVNQVGVTQEAFMWLVDNMGGSIAAVTKSLEDLKIVYDKEYISIAKTIEQNKKESEVAKANRVAMASLADDINSISKEIYGSLGENLENYISPLQEILGDVPNNAKLTKNFKDDLSEIIEVYNNKLIQAQNDKNDAEVAIAEHVIEQAANQYAKAQEVIDKQTKVAELQKANAERTEKAFEKFDSSMNDIANLIASTQSQLLGMISDVAVSAKFIGQPTSVVSLEQQRAVAISGATATNLQARQDFAASRGVDLSLYDIAAEKGGKSGLEGMSEYLEMLEKQKQNIDITNKLYDRLVENAKVEYAFSEIMSDTTQKNLDLFNKTYYAQKDNLKTQLDAGEITKEDYNNQIALLDSQKKIVNSAWQVAEANEKIAKDLEEAEKAAAFSDELLVAYEAAKKITEEFQSAIDDMSGIRKDVTHKVEYKGLFAENKYARDANLESLETSYANAFSLAGGDEKKEEAATLMYEQTKKAIIDGYEDDRVQTFFDATGLSDAFGKDLFDVFASIFE